MKGIWLALAAALFASCAFELDNKASDNGLSPPYYFGGKTALDTKSLRIHTCCETYPPRYVNDGQAEWAINGLATNWWHSSYAIDNPAYMYNGGSYGHTNDTSYFLKAGDASRIDGYTWTQTPALAVNYQGSPLPVASLAPPGGAHWVTLELGSVAELRPGTIARLGYLRRPGGGGGQLGRSGVSYEMYASSKDFGWITGDPHIVLLKTGTVAASDDYQYIEVEWPQTLRFRFLQLRWIVSGDGNNKDASAANFLFKINDRETVNFSYINAVFFRGLSLLNTLRTTSQEYAALKAMLVKIQPRLDKTPDSAMDTLRKRLDLQDAIDLETDDLLALIYSIDPPPKPPEIKL